MPFIWGVIVHKQYIPCQNSRTKGTSLECRLAPENDFYLLKLLHLSCVLVASTLPKILLLGAVFWGLRNLYAEIWKFFTGVCSGTSIHVYCFKHRQHQCRISVQKAALYWWQKKNTSWHRLAESLGRFPTTSYVSVHCGPTLLFLIAYKSVQVWGSYNRKTLLRPLKWIFK